MASLTNSVWPFLSFLFAGCSIIYEFLLAQTLSVVLGQSVYRYPLTIGQYTLALGIGTLLASVRRGNRKGSAFLLKRLIKVEALLILGGGLMPLLVLGMDHYLRDVLKLPHATTAVVLEVVGTFCILWIGILSGMEMPLLNELKELGESVNQKTGDYLVLAWDYAGTLAGAVCFPLWLLPLLGIYQTACLTTLLNLLGTVVLIFTQFNFKLAKVPRPFRSL